MLIQCEHCGAAIPQEAEICHNCRTKRTPQIYSRQEVEVFDPALEGRQKRWRKLVLPFMVALLLFAIAGIICFFAGAFLGEYEPMAIGVVFCFTALVLGVFMYNYETTLKPKKEIIEENKPEQVSEAEYEQRLRDFTKK